MFSLWSVLIKLPPCKRYSGANGLYRYHMDAKNYQHSNTDSRSIDGRIGFNYDFNEYHSIGVRYDLSNALHTDMFTAFDSEIQADGLPYDILYSTIAADANHNRNISLIFNVSSK